MSEAYKVGSLSDVIQKSSKTKKRKSDDQEISKLVSLFSVSTTPEPKIPSAISLTEVKSKRKTDDGKQEREKKKRKLHGETPINKTEKKQRSKSPSKKSSKLKGYDPPPGIVHEALLENYNQGNEDKSEDTKGTERKPRHKNRRDRTKDPRTVFVGNLPISYDKKQVKKLFKSCGTIENLRFRCPPPANLKLPKRAIAITKSFHKERQNIISYVCFEDEESVQKALKLNGKEIDGFHIRVDVSTNAKKHDKTNTVFIGNMTYDVTENDVWSHFEDCGEIENVRLIRDNKTGTGKGIGYVQFQDKDSVQFALKLHQSELKGRQLRVMRCDEKSAKKKEKISNQKGRGHQMGVKSEKEHKKLGFTSTNKKTDPFHHFNDKKNKQLKKKNKSKHVRFNEKSKSHSKQKKPRKMNDKKMKNKKKKSK